ncbi:MAG: cobalamin-dependent protein [Candidatus Woesearchaeota archaeon]
MRLCFVDLLNSKFEGDPKLMEACGAGFRRMESIAVCSLAGHMKQIGYDKIDIVHPTVSEPVVNLDRILKSDPEVVCLSITTPDYPEALKAAEAVKRENPSIKIIVGGYHVLVDPDDVINQPNFDFVIEGEGELGLEGVVRHIDRNIDLSDIEGKVYNKGKLVADNFTRFDLSSTPFRTRDLMEGNVREELFYPPPSRHKFASLQTTAGCKYGCGFCLSTKMRPGGIRYRDIRLVEEEVYRCIEDFGVTSFLVTDSVFAGGNDNPVFMEELCKVLGKTGATFYVMIRLDTDEIVFDLLAEAGVKRIGVGVESYTDKNIKSGLVENPGNYSSRVQRFARDVTSRGMFCRGYFIMGRGETQEQLETERRYIMESGLTDLRISFLIPSYTKVEVSKLYNKGNIYTTDLSKFDGNTPILVSPGLSLCELEQARAEIQGEFYTSERYQQGVRDHLRRFPELHDSYTEFNRILADSLGIQTPINI